MDQWGPVGTVGIPRGGFGRSGAVRSIILDCHKLQRGILASLRGNRRRSTAATLSITVSVCVGDFNNDGQVNGADISGFVHALLIGLTCP